jgi:inosose dehydratase
MTRRTFLASLGATAVALPTLADARNTQLLRFGYAAITWGNQERQAIDDISAVGYPGIQFRANVLTDFKPAELRDLLAQHKLTFVALSSGDLFLDRPAADQIATHVAHAQYLKAAGGLYLQVLDKLKSYPRTATPDECRRLGQLLTELGKRTADIGIPLGYHNHLNTLSQSPENLDRILDNADPRYVKLELDTAHSVAGGGDPAKQIETYHDRLLFLHLKDVIDLPSSARNIYPFEFTELGRGRVNFPAIFTALKKVRFRGWAVVELDGERPGNPRTPKESAIVSKDYLEQKMHLHV